jgi:hypothetical protein
MEYTNEDQLKSLNNLLPKLKRMFNNLFNIEIQDLKLELKDEEFCDPSIVIVPGLEIVANRSQIFGTTTEIEDNFVLIMFTEIPGRFNPYDGGTPPDTIEKEIVVTQHASVLFEQAIKEIAQIAINTALENYNCEQTFLTFLNED